MKKGFISFYFGIHNPRKGRLICLGPGDGILVRIQCKREILCPCLISAYKTTILWPGMHHKHLVTFQRLHLDTVVWLSLQTFGTINVRIWRPGPSILAFEGTHTHVRILAKINLLQFFGSALSEMSLFCSSTLHMIDQ